MRIATIIIATAIAAAGNNAIAQQDGMLPCKNNDADLFHYLHGGDPAEIARIAQAEAELEAFTAEFVAQYQDGQRQPFIIPVVFHIIHNNGSENINDDQLYDAIRILNDDFNKLNPDWTSVKAEFLSIVADVGVEFRLAQKDPQGNCTNGITRTVSTLTYQGDNAMKALIQWPRNRYMNVWVAASANGAAGYTNYPSAFHNNPSGDGIVVQHTYVGSIGTGHPSRSRVLTHEVGHWINLRHAWGNSNNPGLESNCNGDDQVADTPNTIGWTTCFTQGTSCGSLDNVENYMEYSYCSKMFTNGQAARMIAALNSSTAQRNNLWQPANLTLTGVDQEPQLCLAQFKGDRQTICAGGSVTYTDLSYNGVQSRTWSFPGGTPATSSELYPTVTYAAAGVYPVTLQVSDGTNTMEVTQEACITVLPDPGAAVPFEEGFEAYANLGDSDWMLANPDNDNTWTLTNAAAFTGDKSVRILNTSAMNGRKDELISQPLDMSGESEVRLSFRYAYAQRNSSSDDRLRIWVSNNCGATWSMRQQLRGTQNLNTAGAPMTASFVPSGPEQWMYSEVTNVSAAYHVSDFRVKFEFESYGGNNVYLDDINLNGEVVGLEEFSGLADGALAVVPNPAHGTAQVIFDLPQAGMARLEVLDGLGRLLLAPHGGMLPAGVQRMDLSLHGLASGVYFVRLQSPHGSRVSRFVVE
ncbi:MAG: T9SS type A sorting domain-containing protein [Flavobacteriales bacterium]|nr:T9SS type A sorting domain-containing protein [Flavobacteriales bacterium]